MKSFTLAILDADQILRGFEQVATSEEWVHSKERFPVPPECDLAVDRYRLVQFKPGKFRFEAIRHEKDEAVENLQADINAVPVIARLLAVALGVTKIVTKADELGHESDKSTLGLYLKTYDAKRG